MLVELVGEKTVQARGGESGGAAAADAFGQFGGDLLLRLGGGLRLGGLGDKDAATGLLDQEALFGEQVVAALHSEGVDLELRRQLADRGQLLARTQTAATDQELHLIFDLTIDRNAAVGIDVKHGDLQLY